MKRSGSRHKPHGFLADERGSAAILLAPMCLVLCGMAALSVDMINAYATQEELRTAAEAGAAAAVSALPDEEQAVDAALTFSALNAPRTADDDIVLEDAVEVGYWDEEDKIFEANPSVDPVNAVRVTASMTDAKDNPLQTWFGVVLGTPVLDVAASAIAVKKETGIPCMVVLHETAPKALEMKATSTINLPSCEVHVRSTATDALYTDSNASLTSMRNCVAGNYSQLSNSEITPTPQTACNTAGDPFEHVEAPTVGACTHSGFQVDTNATVTTTLSPGVYCGGVQIKGNSRVVLNPGTYVVKDGEFLVDSNSHLTGEGVGIYLAGSASLKFGANTVIHLEAQDSGSMRGLIVFQDRAATTPSNKFDSNAAAVLEGAMYFPNGNFESLSNTTIASASSCTVIIAKTIRFDTTGGVDMSGDLSECPFPLGAVLSSRSMVVQSD